MKRLQTIMLFLILVSALGAQTTNKYDLLTEPYIKRPYTLHQGLLQFSGSYSHIMGNNYFDGDGNKLDFNEVVSSVIEDAYYIKFGYGILELLELNGEINMRNRFETLPTYFVSNNMNFGSENTLYHYKGLGFLQLELKARTPVFLSGFETFLSGGVTIPAGSGHPSQPDHAITIYNPADPGGSYELDYNFNPSPASPATFFHVSLGGRYSNNKVGISVNGTYTSPFKEVETYYWKYRLYGYDFQYSTSHYTIRPKGNIHAGILFDLQLFPWFATYTGYNFDHETPGWSDQTGQPVGLTTSSSGTALVGFEIQVSTHFRMIQQVYLPVTGKNRYSEFHILTGLTYTIAPVLKGSE
ncbi:MAG: hypothetical protein WD052_02735 [Bacteroidales bacterium]